MDYRLYVIYFNKIWDLIQQILNKLQLLYKRETARKPRQLNIIWEQKLLLNL